MKIEKLKSGSYRIRKMCDGKRYSVTVPYKPTQKEALDLITHEIGKVPTEKRRITFQDAAEEYIDLKNSILSPSTIRAYRGILRNLSGSFCRLPLSSIDQIEVQREINRYSINRSPKTVRNAHGFISAVLSMHAPGIVLHTALPQYVKSDGYVPTDEDVHRILAAARGTRYESALMLAVFGLRRSEICALTPDDIGPGVIHVNKAKVATDDGRWIIKQTKTASSTRDVYVPEAVTTRILEIGVFDGAPNTILVFLHKKQAELGIEQFPLHKFRHYYASVSHYLGIPDGYIMAAGGWKTDSVLKDVYRHALADKERGMQAVSGDHIAGLILDHEPDQRSDRE